MYFHFFSSVLGSNRFNMNKYELKKAKILSTSLDPLPPSLIHISTFYNNIIINQLLSTSAETHTPPYPQNVDKIHVFFNTFLDHCLYSRDNDT